MSKMQEIKRRYLTKESAYIYSARFFIGTLIGLLGVELIKKYYPAWSGFAFTLFSVCIAGLIILLLTKKIKWNPAIETYIAGIFIGFASQTVIAHLQNIGVI